jgi:adenylylsulfate kinase-like enzyme
MRKKDHLMRKKDQEIFRRAVELAGSGKCKDWYDVQERLVEKGYRRAPDLLDGEKIRAILDFQCGKGGSQDNGALSRR